MAHYRAKQPDMPVALVGGTDPKPKQYELLAKEIAHRRSQKQNEQPLNWWQLGVPKEKALALLDGRPDGSFVVTVEPESSRHAFALTYVFRRALHEEKIDVNQHGRMRRGFYFSASIDQMQLTLQDLVVRSVFVFFF